MTFGVAMLAWMLIAAGLLPSVSASISGNFIVWGFNAGGALLVKWDTAGTVLTSFVPGACAGVTVCNGRGVAIVHGDLWVTVLDTFTGTGLLYRIDATTGALLGTISDPNGIAGTGAMDDWHGNLLTISYNPVGGLNTVSIVDAGTGVLLASCTVPFGGGSGGADTLAVRDGGKFLTDAGELSTVPPVLTEYNVPSVVGGGPCVATGTTFAPATGGTGLTGIVFFEGSPRLLGSTLGTIVDLGNPPYSSILGSFAAGPSFVVEDIAMASR